jgi:hypothetical protein
VTDKYRPTTEINIRQPAIILLNPDDAGSLLITAELSHSVQQKHIFDYWKQRAIVYQMGMYKIDNSSYLNNRFKYLYFVYIYRS